MEVKRVDREYLIALSVAFEGKIFRLLLVIQMMHTNPPLNRSNLVISWHIIRTIINLFYSKKIIEQKKSSMHEHKCQSIIKSGTED